MNRNTYATAKAFLYSPKGKRWIRWLLGVPLVISLIGFLVLPPIIRHVAQNSLTDLLGRPTEIGKIHFNPWKLTLQIDDFIVHEQPGQGDFVRFKSLLVDLEMLSIIKLAPVIRQVALVNPAATITRIDDTRFNFSDIIERLNKRPATPAANPEEEPFRYSVNNITVTDGRIDYADRTRDTHSTAQEIDIGIPFLSNLPANIQIDVLPAFAAKLDGAPIALKGKSRPFTDSKETSLDIHIDDLPLPEYMKYAPKNLGFTLASAKLATKLALTFVQVSDRTPKLTLTGTTTLKEITIQDKQAQPLFALPLFETEVEAAEIFSTNFQIKKILVQDPELHVNRDAKGAINLLHLLPPAEKSSGAPSPAQTQESTPSPRFAVHEIRLNNGNITWHDALLSPAFSTAITPLDLSILDLTNTADKPAQVNLTLKTSHGVSLKHEGTLTLTPLGVSGSLALDGVALADYVSYAQGKMPFRIEGGSVGVQTRYTVKQQTKGLTVALQNLDVLLRELRLRQEESKQDFFTLPELHISDTTVDVSGQSVAVGQAALSGGKVEARRDKDGVIDLMRLAGPPVAAPPASDVHDVPSPTSEQAAQPAWTIALKKLALQKFAIRFQDQALSRPTTTLAEPVDFDMDDFSTAKNTPANIKLQVGVNKKGRVSLVGPINPTPLGAKLNVDIKDFDLAPFRTYVPDNIKLGLTGGMVKSTAVLTLTSTAEGHLTAAFLGNAGVSQFGTTEKGTQQNLLKWKALTLAGIDFRTDPLNVMLKQIKLDGLDTHVKLAKDGTINLASLIEQNAPPASPPPPKSNPATPEAKGPTIRIDNIKLLGSALQFTDQRVTPNYTTKLTAMDGHVDTLSSAKRDPAGFKLKALINGHSSVDIAGKINPFSKDLFADVTVACKDVDMSPFSPYTRKYVGYPLQQGKLSVDLKYLIDKRSLDAKNQVFFDHLTLGAKTESPDAVAVPLETAISLLTNRKGEIKLDLPVQGSLDDPKFSIFGVVMDVLMNLITKAATAPFSLLSSAFGGGDDLGFVEFAAGHPELSSPAQEKMTKLSEALADRPELKIEVVSQVHPERDRSGAVDYRMTQKVVEQKRSELIDAGQSADKLHDLTLAESEYEKYLTLAYAEADFDKPRNMVGIAKKLPREDMEKLMRENIRISDEDLLQLGALRAEAVRQFLLQHQIEAGRVFVATPVLDAGKDAQGGRINFIIK